jgi:hypothetical protein
MKRPVYPHRHNPDGTHDSICASCFQTVARSRHEAELADAEAQHTCRLGSLAYPLTVRSLAAPVRSRPQRTVPGASH